MRRTRFDDFDECGGKLALVSQHKTKDVMNFAHVVVLLVDAEAAAKKELVSAAILLLHGDGQFESVSL